VSKTIKISKKILKTVGKFNATHKLIGEGDKVLVGLSGGKDSIALVHILKHIKQHAPFDFEFEACTINYGMPMESYAYLEEHCRIHEIKQTTVHTNIFDVSQDTIRQNSSFCSYFSRMRRGALYNYASEHGFNKVALGHHADDAIESFFMNMFYNGAMRTLAPIYKTQRGFHLIRPLIEIRERQLNSMARENEIETIGDEACPAMAKNVKMPFARAKTKEWLSVMEGENENIFKMIQASMKHIHDDTFLDPLRWDRDDIIR